MMPPYLHYSKRMDRDRFDHEELTQGQEKDISISDLTPRKVLHKKM